MLIIVLKLYYIFFLGILTAVEALGAAGQLGLLSAWLKDATGGNIYFINTVIGVLSSLVTNVPLVAACNGKMYPIDPSVLDLQLMEIFLANVSVCAGTGGFDFDHRFLLRVCCNGLREN